MRVLVAGASGVIGRHLVPQLLNRDHEVVALSRSGATSDSRAEIVRVDALDPEAVKQAVVQARPDVVIQQLTQLPKRFNMRTIDYSASSRVRVEGTRNLIAAMSEAGCDRIISQSISFLTANEGPAVLDETAPVASGLPPQYQLSVDTAIETEQMTTDAGGLVMRYGFLYGPGTYITGDGSFGQDARRHTLGIVGAGEGVTSFIHLADAASATVAAMEAGLTGVYNCTDDEPALMKDWVPEFCAAIGAPKPLHVPLWLARVAVGRVGAESAAHGRGHSNAKLRAALPDWTMRYPSWREGFREGL